MSSGPPRLYLITDRSATGGRPLPEVVAAALAGAGAEATSVAVQLREKDLEGRALLVLASELRAVTREAGASLFINDRVDVAIAANADGVHLGGGALSISDVRAVAPALKIAVSTHAVAEVARAAALGVSFVVFGPVFDTPSKRAFGAPSGLEALREAGAHAVPVLALGGIDPSNSRDCLASGAAGLACIRAVMSAPDPARAAAMFLDCFPAKTPAPRT